LRSADCRLRSENWGLRIGERGLKASITRLQPRRAVFLVRLICLPIPNQVRGLKTIYGGFRIADCGVRIAECQLRIIDFLGKNAGFGGGLYGCLVCERRFATAKQCVKPSKTRLQPRRAVFLPEMVSLVVSPKNQASNRLKMRFHPSQSQIHIPQSQIHIPQSKPISLPATKKKVFVFCEKVCIFCDFVVFSVVL